MAAHAGPAADLGSVMPGTVQLPARTMLAVVLEVVPVVAVAAGFGANLDAVFPVSYSVAECHFAVETGPKGGVVAGSIVVGMVFLVGVDQMEAVV